MDIRSESSNITTPYKDNNASYEWRKLQKSRHITVLRGNRMKQRKLPPTARHARMPNRKRKRPPGPAASAFVGGLATSNIINFSGSGSAEAEATLKSTAPASLRQSEADA